MSTATYWDVKIAVLDWMDKVFDERDNVEVDEVIEYVKKSYFSEEVDPDKPCVMWTDGERILVRDEYVCDAMADWIDVHCVINGERVDGEEIRTSYYDPYEDERDNCVDEYTGWYCIDFY